MGLGIRQMPGRSKLTGHELERHMKRMGFYSLAGGSAQALKAALGNLS